MDRRDTLITCYHRLGMSQSDMLRALACNGYIISERHLRRLFVRLSLSRRKGYAHVADVILFIKNELKESGRLHGYRWMWQKCLLHGYNIPRRYVEIILSTLDPDGTAFR